MIQDIIFRVIPLLLFFVILPLLSYIRLVYLCLPAAVPHLSKGQSITLLYCRSPSLIQDIIFRVIPLLLFFVILPLLSYIRLVYLCLPAAVPHLSKGQSITLLYCRSPSILTPHFSLRSFTVPLPAIRLSHYVCILPVRLLSLSVCLSASVLLLLCYQGWLPAYTMYIFIKVTLISHMCNSPYYRQSCTD